MTISSLHIQNFQAHTDLLIELDPGVTTIVGPSDVGKSSVVRALRWAALNAPVSSLIRDGAKQATVELIVDGRKIVRSRGSENVYRLDDQEYKAFRTDVPDAISRLLNLFDVNFQGQHDPIYWFSSTAGDVSRQLNAVVDLSIIDSTLAETVRLVNKAKTTVQIAEETLSRSVAERDGLAWVADADGDLKKVEQREERHGEIKDKLLELNSWVHAANMAKVGAWEAKQLADDSERLLIAMGAAGKAAKRASELFNLVADANRSFSEKSVEIPDLAGLSGAVETLTEIGRQRKSERLTELIRGVREADGARIGELPDTVNLTMAAGRFEVMMSRRRSLEVLLNEARVKSDIVEDAREDAEKAHGELESKTDGRCPLCGKEMNE